MTDNESDTHGNKLQELVCAWCAIPLEKIIRKLGTSKDDEVLRWDEPLLGGTIFAPREIDEDDISSRRYGWRRLARRKKNNVASLTLKAAPTSKLSIEDRLHIARLPSQILTRLSGLE